MGVRGEDAPPPGGEPMSGFACVRVIRIPKRSGGERLVVALPDSEQRKLKRCYLPTLVRIALVLDVHGVAHGFMPGRSIVTNAQQHVGRAWTVCMDIADCFDSVSVFRLQAAGLDADLAYAVTYGGVARQGLCTSPACANIALAPLDGAIMAWLAGRGTYTRYADDLSVSGDDPALLKETLEALPGLALGHGGWIIARHKTRVQLASIGRRIICGVAVDDRVHPPRALRRRLRAAQHENARSRHARGLAEAALLRPPRMAPWLQRARSARLNSMTLADLVLRHSLI